MAKIAKKTKRYPSDLTDEELERIDVSQAMILVAMGGNLLRRNAHP